jgi:signal transduction histidine kinase
MTMITLQFPGYSLAYLINSVLAIAIALAALRPRHSPGAAAFAGAVLAAALWSTAECFQFGVRNGDQLTFWNQVQYVGIVLVAPLWLLFAARHTNSRLLDGWRGEALWFIPLITIALAWTNAHHQLIWTDLNYLPNNPADSVYTSGPWFWVHTVYSYTLVIIGMVLLIRACLNAPGTRVWQTTALVTGALAPLVAYFAYKTGVLPGLPYGLVIFACTFSALIFLPAIFRLRMLDLTPVARETLIDQLDDAVLIIDRSGFITDLNPAVGELLRANTHDWRGKPLITALAGIPALEAFAHANAPAQGSVTLATEPTVQVDIRKTALTSAHEQRLGDLLLLRDVTQAKQAEQREFALALEQERARVLARFIQDSSHEFRTPLSLINTGVYLMSKLSDPEQQRTQRDKITAQVERLNQLLEDMIIMSRLDQGEALALTEVNVNTLLTQAIDSECGTDSEQHRPALSLDLATDLPEVLADAAHLGRAFKNLFCNAVQVCAHGGSIQIVTREEDGRVVVRISDTGTGIEAELQTRIFERFFRKDEAHSTAGMGLGLPMTRAIVEAHGGTIEVHSTPGQGSTFTVGLPARLAVPVPAR